MLESDEEPLVRPVDGRYVVPRIHDTPPPTMPASFRDLEAAERHPCSVVSSVLDQSKVMDSTHAVQVEIAADDAHGAGRRVAVRVDDVRGRPPVAVDMTLADSDTESAVSVPQSEAVSSNQHEDDVSLHHDAGEDSDVDRVSVASGEAPTVPEVEVPSEVPEVRDVSPAIRDAFRRMDGCDVERIFLRRAIVMRTVPMCIRSPYWAAMRVALVEATSETHVQRARGWKLFLLLPRMLLSRPPRGGLVSQEKLRKRFEELFERQ